MFVPGNFYLQFSLTQILKSSSFQKKGMNLVYRIIYMQLQEQTSCVFVLVCMFVYIVYNICLLSDLYEKVSNLNPRFANRKTN